MFRISGDISGLVSSLKRVIKNVRLYFFIKLLWLSNFLMVPKLKMKTLKAYFPPHLHFFKKQRVQLNLRGLLNEEHSRTCSSAYLYHEDITEASAQLEIFSISKDPKASSSDTLVYTVTCLAVFRRTLSSQAHRIFLPSVPTCRDAFF